MKQSFKPSFIAVLLLISGAAGFTTNANAQQITPDLTTALQRGGLNVLLRHPASERTPEASPIDLANCTTQQALSVAGRDEAKAIGVAFRSLKINVAKVFSSPYCRAMDTGKLAFDRAEALDTLINPHYVGLPDAPVLPDFAKRTEKLKQLLAASPAAGTNIVLITHGENIKEAAGLDVARGEAVIIQPDGKGGMLILGRVAPTGWLVK